MRSELAPQRLEVWPAGRAVDDRLAVQDTALDAEPRCRLGNGAELVGPVQPTPGIDPDPATAYMDLRPVAVRLDLVNPIVFPRRMLPQRWVAGLDESSQLRRRRTGESGPPGDRA